LQKKHGTIGKSARRAQLILIAVLGLRGGIGRINSKEKTNRAKSNETSLAKKHRETKARTLDL